MVSSAYIHIPFCKSKCNYCSFVSFSRLDLMSEYVDALLDEISKNYHGEELKTLYFGGGTPSLLPIELFSKIIKCFKLSADYELTVEVNPDSVDFEYLKSLRELGVNRLSIGSQTFDDEILKLIGRRHNSKQIFDTVNFAKKAGFKNISVDLIYGLPTQSLEGLKKDLEKFLSLRIQHISTYGLKIEEGCYWGKYYDELTSSLTSPLRGLPVGEGKNFPLPNNAKPILPSTSQIYLPLPDEDKQADMYEGINEVLEQNCFYRYEVSNFAQKGFESRHNLNYWDNSEYYGFGAAAHGYVDGVRYSNFANLEDYINKPSKRESENILTSDEKLEEEIFLGFRKRSGVNVEEINQKFGIDFGGKYKDILIKYSDYIEKTPSGYTLNLKGVLISNIILAEFL